jgi:hypothetical protein
MRRSLPRSLAVLAVVVAAAASSETSQAAMTIKDPNPPKYGVEIEPKFNLGFLRAFGDYGGNNYGPGVRFSIPIVSPGFIKKLNNNVAITFGADFIYYEGYRYWGYWCNGRRDCINYYNQYSPGFWSLHLPVAMQWNFFLTDKWSVFGEPGLTLRYAFYRSDPYYGTYCANCGDPYGNRFTPYFTFYAGGRFHFSEKVALTMRIGHPVDFSIGVSFFL